MLRTLLSGFGDEESLLWTLLSRAGGVLLLTLLPSTQTIKIKEILPVFNTQVYSEYGPLHGVHMFGVKPYSHVASAFTFFFDLCRSVF